MNNLNETHYKTNKWKCPENSKSECEWHKIEEEMKKLQEEATDKHKYVSAAESVIDSMYNFFNDEWNNRYDYNNGIYKHNVLNPLRDLKDPREIRDQEVNKCRKMIWNTETTTSPGITNTDEVWTKPFKVSDSSLNEDSSIYKKLYPIDTEKVNNPDLNLESEKTEKEYEYVNHPDHYNRYPMEVIEMFEKLYGGDTTAMWCEMTALKYRLRMGLKPGQDCKQDLEKEQWYLNKAEELRKKMKMYRNSIAAPWNEWNDIVEH